MFRDYYQNYNTKPDTLIKYIELAEYSQEKLCINAHCSNTASSNYVGVVKSVRPTSTNCKTLNQYLKRFESIL